MDVGRTGNTAIFVTIFCLAMTLSSCRNDSTPDPGTSTSAPINEKLTSTPTLQPTVTGLTTHPAGGIAGTDKPGFSINWTLVVAGYAAVLSSILGTINLIDRRRQRRRVVTLDHFVVRRPCPDGSCEIRLHFEATNQSEHTVSLKQWLLEDKNGTQLAGSPYEGRAEGPDLLQPRQLHGWTLEPEQLIFVRPPVRCVVVLTTGEGFSTGPIDW